MRKTRCSSYRCGACFCFVIILQQLLLLLDNGNAIAICATVVFFTNSQVTPSSLSTMNTTSLAMRKYRERNQFREGSRINATKNEEDDSKMFIGGLSPELNKQALLKYLSQFGEIIDFIIKIDPNTRLSRGFGFVLFKDSSTVEKVLRVKNHKVDGKKVEFKRAKAIESQFPIKKIFVGGLNHRMSEEKIRAYFGTFGRIEDIQLPLCSYTRNRRAFGFIKYMEESSARKVLETRFHFIGSSRCEVKIAVPKGYPGRQQSKSKTKATARERKTVPTAEFESYGGQEGNQGFHFMVNSDAQEVNLDAHRAGPYTSRANSHVTVRNAAGFRDTPSEFQASPNVLLTSSRAFTASQNAFKSNSNTVGVSNCALGANPNAFWGNQYALGARPNAFRTSEHTLKPNSNAFEVSQYALAAHPNPLGISQCALGTTPNASCTNQYPLGTQPNAFGVSQYASGTSPNAFGVSQYTQSANSNAFRPNDYAFRANPDDLQTNHYVKKTSLSVLRTRPYASGANSNAFVASRYAVGAPKNAFGANENFCGATGRDRNTDGRNFSQVQRNFLNANNPLPAFRGSNGHYFFRYSYGAYDLEYALNCNVQINQPSLLALLSFVYSRATDFFELTWYPAALLKVFISCKSSLEEFWGSLKYTIISSANSEILTSSFPICIRLISLCCRIALARTSSTILNRNVPCIPTLSKAFIMKGCWILSNAFSVSNEMIMCCYISNFISDFINLDALSLHFEKVPWGAEKKQKDGSCFRIHSVSLCLFIGELSLLILREINVQGWNLPSSAFCKAGFVDRLGLFMVSQISWTFCFMTFLDLVFSLTDKSISSIHAL
ncbi:hypothetical protein STEG23_029399 [Scotinomys teguina]